MDPPRPLQKHMSLIVRAGKFGTGLDRRRNGSQPEGVKPPTDHVADEATQQLSNLSSWPLFAVFPVEAHDAVRRFESGRVPTAGVTHCVTQKFSPLESQCFGSTRSALQVSRTCLIHTACVEIAPLCFRIQRNAASVAQASTR